jgi:hypothetical protein
MTDRLELAAMAGAVLDRATSWTAIIAFALGLWLGYLSAVRVAEACHRAHPPWPAVGACPAWVPQP